MTQAHSANSVINPAISRDWAEAQDFVQRVFERLNIQCITLPGALRQGFIKAMIDTGKPGAVEARETSFRKWVAKVQRAAKGVSIASALGQSERYDFDDEDDKISDLLSTQRSLARHRGSYAGHLIEAAERVVFERSPREELVAVQKDMASLEAQHAIHMAKRKKVEYEVNASRTEINEWHRVSRMVKQVEARCNRGREILDLLKEKLQ